MIGAGVVGYAVEARHFADCIANGTMKDRGRLVDLQATPSFAEKEEHDSLRRS
jgi:hypothetical protein